jgi:membrane protease YdiL (CAAX protease family)
VTLMVFAALGQLVIGLGAIIPARLSRTPALVRLGLVTPALPGWGYPVVVLGTLFPLAVGLGLAAALAEILPPSQAVAQLYEQMTWPVAVPFILFIAFAPGFMEELFFRGYIQRRLLERWSPWTAILVCSVLFTFMHLDPHQMAAVFPLGIWLGVVAWRTGSVWPGMLCHAFINGAWNIFQIGSRLGRWPETTTTAVAVVAGAVGLACFCGSIGLMARRPGARGTDAYAWPDQSDDAPVVQ